MRHPSLKAFTIMAVIVAVLFISFAGMTFYQLGPLKQQYEDNLAMLTGNVISLTEQLTETEAALQKSLQEKSSQLTETIDSVRNEALEGNKQVLGTLANVEEQSKKRLEELKENVDSISMQSGDLAPLVQKILPSVVSVLTNVGSGSGVVVDDKGRIITNYHVLKGATAAAVVDSTGGQHPVNLMGFNEERDLAILNISKKLPYMKIEESEPKVGEQVIAAGNPLGLDFSITEGIVSGIRNIRSQDFIQHSVPINPGNSGGPLINKKGEIVGINTFKISGGEGLGFAIPAYDVDDFYNRFT